MIAPPPLACPCGWHGPDGQCPAHTPAVLAGHPEPGAGRYCPPALCWCGRCPAPQGGVLSQPQAAAGIRAAALGYIRDGWPVFVLGRSKRPVANCGPCRNADPAAHDPVGCGCLTCHGFYAATVDAARLAAMLRVVPGGLLAIRTGTISGLAVVDIDPRNGGRIDPALMTPTATVATGGAAGTCTTVTPARRLPPPCPATPASMSRPTAGTPSARRQPIPEPAAPTSERGPAMSLRCPPRSARPSPRPPRRPRPARQARSGSSARGASQTPPLAAHLRAVEHAPEGRRRVTLYGAAHGVARMVTAGALSASHATAALTAAGLAAGQTPRDIRAAIIAAFKDEGAAA